MIVEFLSSYDIFSWQIIALLIFSGFLVGIINTIAGSGTIISYSFFILLGLPPGISNGTTRLGVILQTLAASLNFKKQNVLDIKKGIILGIPTVIGSIVGAQIAISLNKNIFELIVGFVMILMLFFIFYNPDQWIKGRLDKVKRKPTYIQLLIFFVIGVYGGFIHIGVGIFLLAALVLNAGYDLVKANALKVFIVLLYSPFALAIFMYNNQVEYGMGLISAIGNVFGGYIASQFAVTWGANIIRWMLVIIIVLYTSHLFGLFELLFS
ncbi:MAG TPA: hypothetical protein DDX39_11360 [Bacteroidales bacterium]|nr:MAG: hypothetical protein A2W98_13955 [Bacteroidetes bacterium GWF2_33_38]OFY74266.1 MAG: hypothetical protein A2265_01040 [Bacteroidetes bacterium RIFOXYA12_FULL_33_9]OFY86224.1 MAG: hypothetical protein A2236_13930 [Bacteroidetes bacterium RIFOXYA2_FULL_33_7]HBF89229.1 hypothetical protein [Bacteroidales bacterium]